MRKPIMTFFAVLAATVAASAHADAPAPGPVETTSVEVPYGDLDLTKPAGTAALDARIDRALDKVCAKPDLRLLKATQDYEACTAKARDAAMEQLSLTNPFEGIALASAF